MRACVARRAVARAAPQQGYVALAATQGDRDARRLYDELKHEFGYMGIVNHKKVSVLDIYEILKAARKPSHYRLALQAMNTFYNFGVKLTHRELSSRLLAAAMACGLESEAVDLIKLYGTWLEHPPDKRLVYAVMGHFLDAGQPLVVRELAKAVREDWRMPLEAPLYVLVIEAMLQLEEEPLQEALVLHADARRMEVRLPAQTHAQLLDLCLQQGALESAQQVAEMLLKDGHLGSGADAATLCSVAWLLWLEPSAGVLGGSWARVLQTALENFGSVWGFSPVLPRGLFAALEASEEPEAVRLVRAARLRLGRFYPQES